MPTNLITRLQSGEADNAEVLTALGYSHRWVGGEVISTYKGDKLFSRRGLWPLDSVDDALRLVGDGWEFSHASYDADENVMRVWLWNKEKYEEAFGKCANSDRIKALRLALVIAILRTRETTND